MSFDSEDKYKLFEESNQTAAALSFVLITESAKKLELTLRNLDFGHLTSNSKQVETKPVKFDSLVLKSGDLLLENVCLFSKSNLLALFYDHQLFVVDTRAGSILLEKNFTMPEIKVDYFLSPTNLNSNSLFNLTPVENSNCFLALSNLDQLVLVDYLSRGSTLSPELKKIVSNSSSIKFSSYKVNKNILVAFSKNANKFVFYELDRLRKFMSFGEKKAILAEKQFGPDSIIPEHLYGMSRENNYFYTIENNKTLKFFKLAKHEQCMEIKLQADIYLYCKPRGIICNEEFIGLSMSDFKLISYLIGDPNNMEQTMARIKKLPSRYLKYSITSFA